MAIYFRENEPCFEDIDQETNAQVAPTPVGENDSLIDTWNEDKIVEKSKSFAREACEYLLKYKSDNQDYFTAFSRLAKQFSDLLHSNDSNHEEMFSELSKGIDRFAREDAEFKQRLTKIAREVASIVSTGRFRKEEVKIRLNPEIKDVEGLLSSSYSSNDLFKMSQVFLMITVSPETSSISDLSVSGKSKTPSIADYESVVFVGHDSQIAEQVESFGLEACNYIIQYHESKWKYLKSFSTLARHISNALDSEGLQFDTVFAELNECIRSFASKDSQCMQNLWMMSGRMKSIVSTGNFNKKEVDRLLRFKIIDERGCVSELYKSFEQSNMLQAFLLLAVHPQEVSMI